MSDKIYPANKIIVKNPEDILSFDYLSPTVQILFNYLVSVALNNKNNIIKTKVADYFNWNNTTRPQGKHYTLFYKNLEILKHSFVVCQEVANNKKIKYEWPLIAETKTIKNLKNKTESIEITFNPYLLDFYKWQRANVQIDINVTKNLNAKYAYKLYEFLCYKFRKNAKNNNINIDELRRILTTPKNERNERFLLFLAKAIKNINETTATKVQAKVKTKNKKSLASAEIKFINLTEKIAKKQYDFLVFVRDFKQKNEE